MSNNIIILYFNCAVYKLVISTTIKNNDEYDCYYKPYCNFWDTAQNRRKFVTATSCQRKTLLMGAGAVHGQVIN